MAWELVKRIGVPMLNGDRKMTNARFRLSVWEEARDAATKPATPRLPARPSYIPASAEIPARPPVKPKIDKLARLRNS